MNHQLMNVFSVLAKTELMHQVICISETLDLCRLNGYIYQAVFICLVYILKWMVEWCPYPWPFLPVPLWTAALVALLDAARFTLGALGGVRFISRVIHTRDRPLLMTSSTGHWALKGESNNWLFTCFLSDKNKYTDWDKSFLAISQRTLHFRDCSHT